MVSIPAKMSRRTTTVVVTLFFIVLGTVEVNCLRRAKRQTIRVILNETVPCEQLQQILTQENGGIPPRWIELNDEDKKHLLQMRGFDFQQSFMATKSNFNTARVYDPLQRTSLLRASVGAERQMPSTRPFLRSEILDFLKKNSHAKDAAAFRFSDASSAASDDAKADDAARIPYVLPQDIGLNGTLIITALNGFVMSIDYCTNRSSYVATVDGSRYLRMCTICSTTTTCPSDVWPAFLYGAMCSSEENACLYEGTVSYGRCISTSMAVKMLRKSMDTCVLVLENGQKVISEDWKPFDYFLGIGCECAVSEASRFR